MLRDTFKYTSSARFHSHCAMYLPMHSTNSTNFGVDIIWKKTPIKTNWDSGALCGSACYRCNPLNYSGILESEQLLLSYGCEHKITPRVQVRYICRKMILGTCTNASRRKLQVTLLALEVNRSRGLLLEEVRVRHLVPIFQVQMLALNARLQITVISHDRVKQMCALCINVIQGGTRHNNRFYRSTLWNLSSR